MEILFYRPSRVFGAPRSDSRTKLICDTERALHKREEPAEVGRKAFSRHDRTDVQTTTLGTNRLSIRCSESCFAVECLVVSSRC